MSCIETLKISNKNAIRKTIDYKNRQKRAKNKIIFNTMIDLDKFKTKKISKSKSSSIIITKKKNSEKKRKRHIFIPINLGAPLIKTYNTKKKIEYNKSASDIINNNPLKGFSNKNCNNYDYDSFHKNKKNSQHNTINYIINNINLSLKKKEFNGNNKNREFKGINRSLISNNNNSKYEELKKENENLTFIFAEKLKENKKHKDKINYLENKNCNLIKKVDKIKKENEKYSKILEKVLKLLQILKKNGLDIEEILENLSETEDELDNNSYSEEDNSSFHSKKSSENNYGINSEFSRFNSEGESIPSNNIKENKLYKGSKVNLKDNSIPKLDMKKIYNNENIKVKKIEKRHKNYSHSVGK